MFFKLSLVNTCKYRHGEMIWEFYSLWYYFGKGRGKGKKKKVITTQGIRILSPSEVGIPLNRALLCWLDKTWCYLFFSSLARQIQTGLARSCAKSEIVDGVICSVTPVMLLGTYPETYKDFALDWLKKMSLALVVQRIHHKNSIKQ